MGKVRPSLFIGALLVATVFSRPAALLAALPGGCTAPGICPQKKMNICSAEMPCTFEESGCDKEGWAVPRDNISLKEITVETGETCRLTGFKLDVFYPLEICPGGPLTIPYDPNTKHVKVKLMSMSKEFDPGPLGEAPEPNYDGMTEEAVWNMSPTDPRPRAVRMFDPMNFSARELDPDRKYTLEVELYKGGKLTGRDRSVLQSCSNELPCAPPHSYQDLKGLKLDVVDSQNCCPDSGSGGQCDPEPQDVRTPPVVFGGDKDCYYQFCMTVEGVVETEDAPYDYVCVDEPGGPPCEPNCKGFFFGGYERDGGCVMATRSQQRIVTIRGDSAELGYNTGDALFHVAAMAKITDVEFIRAWRGAPPETTDDCLTVPEEPCLPECYSPSDCEEGEDYGQSSDPNYTGPCRCIPCENVKGCDLCKVHRDCKKLGQKVSPDGCGCVPCDKCPIGEGPNTSTDDPCDCAPCPTCPEGYTPSNNPQNPCECVPCGTQICLPGYKPGPNCACVPCDEGCDPGEVSGSNCECSCPDGHNMEDGNCQNGTQPDPTTENVCDCRCPASSDKGIDGTCPEGQVEDFDSSNVCDCICPDSGTDSPDCPSGMVPNPNTSNVCDCHCGPGTDLGDGQCAPGEVPDLTTENQCDCHCPEGSDLADGSCPDGESPDTSTEDVCDCTCTGPSCDDCETPLPAGCVCSGGGSGSGASSSSGSGTSGAGTSGAGAGSCEPPENGCPFGSTWVAAKCKCVCLPPEGGCPPLTTWNEPQCKCVSCKPPIDGCPEEAPIWVGSPTCGCQCPNDDFDNCFCNPPEGGCPAREPDWHAWPACACRCDEPPCGCQPPADGCPKNLPNWHGEPDCQCRCDNPPCEECDTPPCPPDPPPPCEIPPCPPCTTPSCEQPPEPCECPCENGCPTGNCGCEPPEEGCPSNAPDWKGYPDCQCHCANPPCHCEIDCPEGETKADDGCYCEPCQVEPGECPFGVGEDCECLPCPEGDPECTNPPCPPLPPFGPPCAVINIINGCPVWAVPPCPPGMSRPPGQCACVPNNCQPPADGCPGCTEWNGQNCRCEKGADPCPGKYCRCVHGKCKTPADKNCPDNYVADGDCKCVCINGNSREACEAADGLWKQKTCECLCKAPAGGCKAQNPATPDWDQDTCSCICKEPPCPCDQPDGGCQDPALPDWEGKPTCACVCKNPPCPDDTPDPGDCCPDGFPYDCPDAGNPDNPCDYAPCGCDPDEDWCACSEACYPELCATETPTGLAASSINDFATLNGLETIGSVVAVGTTFSNIEKLEGQPLPEPQTLEITLLESNRDFAASAAAAQPQSVRRDRMKPWKPTDPAATAIYVKGSRNFFARMFSFPEFGKKVPVLMPTTQMGANPQLYRRVSEKKWAPMPGKFDGKVLTAPVYHYGFYQVFSPIPNLPFSFGEVYVFPNPTKGGEVPTIHVEVGQANQVTARIYDVSGDLVYEARIDENPVLIAGKPSYEHAMNPSLFKSGVYHGVVTAEKSGKETIRKKFRFSVVK